MAGRTALECALDLLARRDHGEEELRRKLRRRGFAEGEIDETLGRLREKGYVDDRRYAATFADSAARSGKAVGERLVQELRRRGIPREIAAEAAAGAAGNHDGGMLLRELIRRRFSGYDHGSAEPREKRRVIGYLLRRGFDFSVVARILGETNEN
jgi:regulatory protein